MEAIPLTAAGSRTQLTQDQFSTKISSQQQQQQLRARVSGQNLSTMGPKQPSIQRQQQLAPAITGNLSSLPPAQPFTQLHQKRKQPTAADKHIHRPSSVNNLASMALSPSCPDFGSLAASQERVVRSGLTISEAKDELWALRVAGPLVKRGFRHRKKWVLRWVVLAGRRLTYFEKPGHEASGRMRECLELTPSTYVSEAPEETGLDGRFVFYVVPGALAASSGRKRVNSFESECTVDTADSNNNSMGYEEATGASKAILEPMPVVAGHGARPVVSVTVTSANLSDNLQRLRRNNSEIGAPARSGTAPLMGSSKFPPPMPPASSGNKESWGTWFSSLGVGSSRSKNTASIHNIHDGNRGPATVVGNSTRDVRTGIFGDDMDVDETKAVLRARHNPDAVSDNKNDQCVWRFRARSEEERQHWMKAIRRSVYLVARVETTPTLCGVGSVHDHYKLGATLSSSGAFGKLRLALARRTNQAFCVRSINKSRHVKTTDAAIALRTEIRVMRKAARQILEPALCKLYQAYEDGFMIYLVTEYVQGGSLKARVSNASGSSSGPQSGRSWESGRFSEVDAAVVTAQIARALRALHSAGIAMGEVYPSDVVFVHTWSLKVKLVNFSSAVFLPAIGGGTTKRTGTGKGARGGVAGAGKRGNNSNNIKNNSGTAVKRAQQQGDQQISNSSTRNANSTPSAKSKSPKRRRSLAPPFGSFARQQLVGHLQYLAPETHRSQRYSTYSDMWSLGCCLFFMLKGKHPFPKVTSRQVFADVSNTMWKQQLQNLDMDLSDPENSGEVQVDISGKVEVENSGKLEAENSGKVPMSAAAAITPRCRAFVMSLLDTSKDARLTASEAIEHGWVEDPLNVGHKNLQCNFELVADVHAESRRLHARRRIKASAIAVCALLRMSPAFRAATAKSMIPPAVVTTTTTTSTATSGIVSLMEGLGLVKREVTAGTPDPAPDLTQTSTPHHEYLPQQQQQPTPPVLSSNEQQQQQQSDTVPIPSSSEQQEQQQQQVISDAQSVGSVVSGAGASSLGSSEAGSLSLPCAQPLGNTSLVDLVPTSDKPVSGADVVVDNNQDVGELLGTSLGNNTSVVFSENDVRSDSKSGNGVIGCGDTGFVLDKGQQQHEGEGGGRREDEQQGKEAEEKVVVVDEMPGNRNNYSNDNNDNNNDNSNNNYGNNNYRNNSNSNSNSNNALDDNESSVQSDSDTGSSGATDHSDSNGSISTGSNSNGFLNGIESTDSSTAISSSPSPLTLLSSASTPSRSSSSLSSLTGGGGGGSRGVRPQGAFLRALEEQLQNDFGVVMSPPGHN